MKRTTTALLLAIGAVLFGAYSAQAADPANCLAESRGYGVVPK
jgi:hypothetical protein